MRASATLEFPQGEAEMAETESGINPYATPKSAVVESGPQYEPVKIFSPSGRIGRARYITYGVGLYILIAVPGGALGTLIGPFAGAISFAAALVIAFLLTIQRCHDFNTTGWLSLLM